MASKITGEVMFKFLPLPLLRFFTYGTFELTEMSLIIY